MREFSNVAWADVGPATTRTARRGKRSSCATGLDRRLLPDRDVLVAARQLGTSGAGLAEIARVAGYESEFSFSRAFKRTFGVAPRAYCQQDDGRTALNDFVMQPGAEG